MLLAQGQICAKNMTVYVRIGCVRFARCCGKMYSRHLFPYGGLAPFLPILRLRAGCLSRQFGGRDAKQYDVS